MSRFFAAGSDSDSDTSSSEGEGGQFLQTKPAVVAPKGFLLSDDDEVESKRVVRSAKDKRYEEIKNLIKNIRNQKKIKDVARVLETFEDLAKAYTKAKQIVDKEGSPRFYIRCLAEIDNFIIAMWDDREGRKKLSKLNSKALGTLRQKLRKYLVHFREAVDSYKENPDGSGDESSEDEAGQSESGSDDVTPAAAASDFLKKSAAPAPAPASVPDKSKFLKKTTEDGSDSSDDEDWDSDEDDSSVSSYDEDAAGNLAAQFLKKAPAEKGEVKKRERERKERIIRRREDEEGSWEKVKGGIPTEKPKMFTKDSEINHDAVLKKLAEIVAVRGKKGTDRNEQINLLHELRDISNSHELGPAMGVKITLAIIYAIYDYNPKIAECMKQDMWTKCLENFKILIDSVTSEESQIIISNVATEDDELIQEAKPTYVIRGDILSVGERLVDEFVKILQNSDAHSTEYVTRLRDEPRILGFTKGIQNYVETHDYNSDVICRIYMLHITLIYYKEMRSDETVSLEMDRLSKYIYSKDSTDRIRARTLLCHVYHHALHDRWFEARDLMLMSHLQETIQYSDVPTQIMYNRGLVQLGLSAFRHGNIKDAHNALLDIQSSGRAKELLAQGLLQQKQQERTAEQEKIEKRRQMPFHMHINLEVLECVYLVSAMLLEIPYMAAHEFDARRRMISKSFHHQLRLNERQNLVGPPESMREHVIAAAKLMKTGNWTKCYNLIINEKMNTKVWNLFTNSEQIRCMIKTKIQEEALRTYMFTYGNIYDSLGLQTLGEMFELDTKTVHRIISKMIINEELMASLDEPTQTVMMHRTEPSRLQNMALQLSDKLNSLLDTNERLMEQKSQKPGMFGKDRNDRRRVNQRSNQKQN